MRSGLPSSNEPVAGPTGLISATWYRLLAHFERLIDGAVTNPGTGLAVSAAGALEIADNGVSNGKLRQSLPLSVMGNPLNAESDPQDIQAGSDGGFLQRDAGLVVFRYPKLPSFTVAARPTAAGQGAGTLIFNSDSGVPAFCNGSSWTDFGAGGGGTAGVSSFNSRTGAVTLSSGDVTGALGFTPQASGSYLTTPSVLTKTVAYTEAATSGINVRLCNNASGFTVTLPSAVGNTAILIFKVLAATGSITLSPVSAQTIDGGSTAVLPSQYESVTLVSDNANWWVT